MPMMLALPTPAPNPLRVLFSCGSVGTATSRHFDPQNQKPSMSRISPMTSQMTTKKTSTMTSQNMTSQNKTSQNLDEARVAANAAVASEFVTLHEIVRKARANLNQNDWDYIVGGTETETTLRRNRMALDSIALRPRVLRDVSKVDPSVEVLGRKLRLPIVLCPVGSLESFNPRGAEPVVKAAAEFGVAHMLSW